MKKASEEKLKKRLMIAIIIFLFLPLIQGLVQVIKLRPLDGAIEYAQKPTISDSAWFNGDLQTATEKYINQQFGFRNFLVRLNNQVDYWLFNKANAKGVVIGTDHMLYEKYYTDAYFGINYVGVQEIENRSLKLKFLSDTLAKLNKTLIILQEPGKASFFPSNIPGEYVTVKTRTNYEGYRDELTRLKLNYIDMNKWFLQLKADSPHPLYPNLGIHWNAYGAALAIDSLTRYIEKIRGEDLPEMKIVSFQFPDTLRDPDNDIYLGLNLLFKMPYYKMAYPVIDVKNNGNKKMLNVVTIGDSYWFNVVKMNVMNKLYKNHEFWYYNTKVYPESYTRELLTKDINFNKKVEETDVFILNYTESTLQDIGSGFIDKLFYYFTVPSDEASLKKKAEYVKAMMDYIRSDKNWLGGIQHRADSLKVPLDTLLKKDATWQVEHGNK